MVGVNRVGSDAVCDYGGGSVVIDPLGRTMTACSDGLSWASADVDAGDIAKARQRFRVLDDRDLTAQEIL